jgi:hypothetical protein
MNLYLVSCLPEGGDTNLDWHVVAETPSDARKVWADHVTSDFHWPSEPEDAERVHLVISDVDGPARPLDWCDAEPPRYFAYAEDNPAGWMNVSHAKAIAEYKLHAFVTGRFVANGAGEGAIFDRVSRTIVFTVVTDETGAIHGDPKMLSKGFIDRMLAAADADPAPQEG